jgi:hypothetical protein
MSDKIIKLYTSILKYASMEPDQEGFISTVHEDKRYPTIVDGKRLVLPTNQHLRNPSPDVMIFHPLTESPFRGESDVLAKLRDVINIKLNFITGIVARSLLSLAASPELNKRLHPSQMAMAIACKDATSETVKNFTSIMMAGLRNPASLFTHIFLLRGGFVNNVRYSRIGVASFPFYEELVKGADVIHGIKVNAKDREVFKKLMEFIFPDIEKPEAYNYGSNASTAPFMDSLMHSSGKLAARLNDMLEVFADYIDSGPSLVFDSEWTADFENIDALALEIKRVPPQAGNEGKPPITEQQPVAQPQVVQQPQIQQPVQQQTPQLPVPQQPQYVQPAQPQYIQQAPQQQPQPQKPSGGPVDLRTMMASVPGSQYLPNPLGMQQGMYPMQQMIQEPTWARPQQMIYPQQQMIPQGMYPQQQMIYPQQGMYPQQQIQQPMYPQQVQQPIYPQQQPAGYPPAPNVPQQIGIDAQGRPVYR